MHGEIKKESAVAKIFHPHYAALCVAGPAAAIVLFEDKKKPAT